MSYSQQVKEVAYALDPECWQSYSGKPKAHKQAMEVRRTATLAKAQQLADRANGCFSNYLLEYTDDELKAELDRRARNRSKAGS